MRPDVPIFDLTDTFKTAITLGATKNEKTGEFEGGHILPVTIKRFSRAEMEAFEKKWNAYFVEPRGDAEQTPEATAEREAQLLKFAEEAISDAVTLEEGYVRDRGEWVTTGAGLIRVFHARRDVLSVFLIPIYTENKLAGVLTKNSKSLRDSGTGSTDSSEARSGKRPEPAVRSAASSNSAPSEAATASQDVSGTGAAGVSGEATKVH